VVRVVDFYEEIFELERLYNLWQGIHNGEVNFRKEINEKDIDSIKSFISMVFEIRSYAVQEKIATSPPTALVLNL
jgi:hypothetical protein